MDFEELNLRYNIHFVPISLASFSEFCIESLISK